MTAGKVMLGIATGVAAGAILGVLFAPAKGEVTRRRLSRKARNYTDEVKDKFEESVDAITEKYDALKESALEWAEKGKDRVEAHRPEMKHAKA